MAEFTPPPPVVDNWRDHAKWDGPACTECGHPLWAPRSVARGVCWGCDPYAVAGYDGPPFLVSQQVEHE